MAEQFNRILEESARSGIRISVENLGIRPCGGDVPTDLHNALLSRCRSAVIAEYSEDIPFCAASTDANIPLSLGIPAATFGLYRGGGAHTREEYVNIDSLTPGLKIALNFFLHKSLSDGSIDNTLRP
jgi:acetylornithine deacetylase/succinyl-diaminopimelate desuccinylase-like protein